MEGGRGGGKEGRFLGVLHRYIYTDMYTCTDLEMQVVLGIYIIYFNINYTFMRIYLFLFSEHYLCA